MRYVFKVSKGTFGILTYHPQTSVALCYLPDANSVMQAVAMLQRSHTGGFRLADRDQEAWGKVTMRSQSETEVLLAD